MFLDKGLTSTEYKCEHVVKERSWLIRISLRRFTLRSHRFVIKSHDTNFMLQCCLRFMWVPVVLQGGCRSSASLKYIAMRETLELDFFFLRIHKQQSISKQEFEFNTSSV